MRAKAIAVHDETSKVGNMHRLSRFSPAGCGK